MRALWNKWHSEFEVFFSKRIVLRSEVQGHKCLRYIVELEVVI